MCVCVRVCVFSIVNKLSAMFLTKKIIGKETHNKDKDKDKRLVS